MDIVATQNKLIIIIIIIVIIITCNVALHWLIYSCMLVSLFECIYSLVDHPLTFTNLFVNHFHLVLVALRMVALTIG